MYVNGRKVIREVSSEIVSNIASLLKNGAFEILCAGGRAYLAEAEKDDEM